MAPTNEVDERQQRLQRNADRPARISVREIRHLLIALSEVNDYAPGRELPEILAGAIEEVKRVTCGLAVAHRKHLTRGCVEDAITALELLRAHLGFLDERLTGLKKLKADRDTALTPFLRELIERKAKETRELQEYKAAQEKRAKGPLRPKEADPVEDKRESS